MRGTPSLVLVTGASGFVGGHVVREFLEQGWRVRGTVRHLADPCKVDHLHALGRLHDGRLELVQADLERDEGWEEAARGCDVVQHVASPVPSGPPSPAEAEAIVGTAVDGTRRVLGAAANAGSVRRVVLTSSFVAVGFGHDATVNGRRPPYTEDDWSVAERCQPYPRSKTLAERAAWDFVGALPPSRGLELATILPGFVAGPLLSSQVGVSGEVVGRFLRREIPACPRIGLCVVDVRDLAVAHRLAAEVPAAGGERFLVAGEHLWMQEIARLLAAEFGPEGYRIPTWHLPRPLMWLGARFDRTVRLALEYVDREMTLSHAKATRLLGWTPRPARETLVEMARSMIDRGIIPRPRR